MVAQVELLIGRYLKCFIPYAVYLRVEGEKCHFHPFIFHGTAQSVLFLFTLQRKSSYIKTVVCNVFTFSIPNLIIKVQKRNDRAKLPLPQHLQINKSSSIVHEDRRVSVST